MKRNIMQNTNNLDPVNAYIYRISSGIGVSGSAPALDNFNKFNDKSQYNYYAISFMPGSTDENTVVTNDGIIAVFHDNFIEYADLVDTSGSTSFDNITSLFSDITSYSKANNPIRTKRFILVKNGNSTEILKNVIYKIGNNFIVDTDMDFNETSSNTDEIGKFISASSNNFTTISLREKQFYLLRFEDYTITDEQISFNNDNIGILISSTTDTDGFSSVLIYNKNPNISNIFEITLTGTFGTNGIGFLEVI